MIEQRIRARVGAYSVPAVVHAVQGDTGRVFVFELEDYTITSAEGASLNCQRPDKSFYTYAGTVSAEDNTVTVALDDDGGALTQEGVVTFQLELTEAGLIVCTFRGSIIVEPVVGGEATQEEKDFRDAIQAQLNNKASNSQLAQVASDLSDSIDGVADDLAQEILDREAADATKANKTTTINGKSLEADRTLYVQDIPSKNLLPNNTSTTTTNGVTFTVNDDGSISTSGTASSGIQFTIGSLTLKSGIQYAFTGCPSGGDLGSYFINFSGVVNDTGNGATATPASDVTTNAVINIVSGTNMNGKVFRPMIRLASIEDDSYVPYAKTNAELSKYEYSSNYVKFPDGTLIQWAKSNSITSGWQWSWSFPVSFTNTDYGVSITMQRNANTVTHASNLIKNAGSLSVSFSSQPATDTPLTIHAMAIGRWK